MFQYIRFALLWLALPLLAACAGVAGRDAAIYGAAPGPHAVGTASNLVLHDAAQSRDIPLRVLYPQAAGRSPVLVYSHGAFCYPQNYAVITEHWAAHGYVVVLPDHPDSPNNQPPLRLDQMGGLVQTRIADLNFIFANLDKIAAAAGIAGQLDTDRLAVAGHSFGSVIAMAKAGLWVRTPDGGRMQYLDPRIRAAVLENGDHYLGGLICRPDRGGDDDPEGAALDAALTLAFLDAYVKNNPQAVRFLNSADIPALSANRVRFERK